MFYKESAEAEVDKLYLILPTGYLKHGFASFLTGFGSCVVAAPLFLPVARQLRTQLGKRHQRRRRSPANKINRRPPLPQPHTPTAQAPHAVEWRRCSEPLRMSQRRPRVRCGTSSGTPPGSLPWLPRQPNGAKPPQQQ